jgi:hypothetical protein
LAADATLRRYHETTPIDEKSVEGAAHAMRVGAKDKNMKLYVKMIKLLTVANPAHGAGFLQEVSTQIWKIMSRLFSLGVGTRV